MLLWGGVGRVARKQGQPEAFLLKLKIDGCWNAVEIDPKHGGIASWQRHAFYVLGIKGV